MTTPLQCLPLTVCKSYFLDPFNFWYVGGKSCLEATVKLHDLLVYSACNRHFSDSARDPDLYFNIIRVAGVELSSESIMRGERYFPGTNTSPNKLANLASVSSVLLSNAPCVHLLSFYDICTI